MSASTGVFIYRALLALAVAGGWVAAYARPRAPILSWWLFCALAFGTWLAFEDAREGLRARAGRLVLLHTALLLSALGSTQLAARRVSAATHLRYRGVLVERARELSIGSGVAHADVLLPTVSPEQGPWRMVVRKDDAGWTLDRATDVEQLRLSPADGGEGSAWEALFTFLRLKGEPFEVANAVLLSERSPVALVSTRAGVVDTVRLEVDGERVRLRSREVGQVALDPVSPRLATRYRRMLAAGTSLALLDAERPARRAVPLPVERLLRVQELSARRHVNGDWSPALPLLRAPRRFLLSASAPLSVRLPGGGVPTGHVLRDSTRVEVRHGGGVWRFDLVAMQRTQAADSGLAIRFVATPRVMDVPLPAAGECEPGVACGLLSLRPLPSPIAHVSLAGAGLDTSRFALLGALRATRGGLSLALGRETIEIPGGGWAAVPVDSIEREDGVPRRPTARPSRWLLLGAANNSLNGVLQLVGVAVALAGLLLLVLELTRLTGGMGLRGGTPTESSLALALSAVLTLLTTRVVLGARVTFFSPENPAGLDTAIGMFVAIALATVGLLLWGRWVPDVLRLAQAAASTVPGAVREWWSTRRAAAAQVVGERRRARARLPYLAGALALVLGILFVVSPRAVLFGGSAGVLVVGVWLLMAWIGAFGGVDFHAFAESPCDVVEHDGGTEGTQGGVTRWLVRLSLQWTATLWNPIAGVTIAALMLLLRDLPRVRSLRRTEREAAAGGVGTIGEGTNTTQRSTGEWLTALAVLLSTLTIAGVRFLSENGAMASFLLIILVSLTSVRIGRSLSTILGSAAGAGPVGMPGVPTPVPQPPVAAAVPSAAPAPGDMPAPAGSASPTTSSAPLPASGWRVLLHLIAPLFLLAPLAIIDMGLLLVTVLPIGAASLLAVGWRGLGRGARVGAAALALTLGGVLWFKVLFPPLGAIADPEASYVARAERFASMQRLAGIPLTFAPPVQGSLERTAARAVATRDQQAAERLLVAAYPGNARDLLMPSIEQVWGGRVYSASGLAGHGQGTAPTRGHGIAEPVSYAENSFAVYVLYEHGALAGILLLVTYLAFAYAVLSAMYGSVTKQVVQGAEHAELRASRALFLVAALLVTVPTAYVALSNLGVVPITGQNIPFLGLNAWSDVTLAAGVCGMLMTAAVRTLTRRGRGR